MLPLFDFNTFPVSSKIIKTKSDLNLPYRLDHRLGYLISFDLQFGELCPPGRYRITFALVRLFGHVLHFIRAIYRSFYISYFYIDLLMSFSHSSFHLSVLMRRVQWMRELTLCMGSPFLIAFHMGPLIIFQGLTASLIGHPGNFALPAVMEGTEIALLSQSTLTHRLQWTLCFQARG